MTTARRRVPAAHSQCSSGNLTAGDFQAKGTGYGFCPRSPSPLSPDAEGQVVRTSRSKRRLNSPPRADPNRKPVNHLLISAPFNSRQLFLDATFQPVYTEYGSRKNRCKYAKYRIRKAGRHFTLQGCGWSQDKHPNRRAFYRSAPCRVPIQSGLFRDRPLPNHNHGRAITLGNLKSSTRTVCYCFFAMALASSFLVILERPSMPSFLALS